MATRNISTKLAIDGEAQYRAALSGINSEIKTLQSSLKLVDSEFQGNANSMTALSAKGEALQRLWEAQKTKVDSLKEALENAKNAQQTYADKCADLRDRIQKNNEALEKLKTTEGDTSAEQAKLTAENAALSKELATNEQYLAAAEKGVNNWQTQLNNAEVELNSLDAKIADNNKYMQEAEQSADNTASSIDEFGNKIKESGEAVDALSQALVAAGVAAALKEIADAMKECVSASMEFETAMAGVKRTVGGDDAFISALGESFKEMSTVMPITANELAAIAQTAGQLGIPQASVEAFTSVMAQLATTTDLTADNAATMLAQFANITGVTEYDRLGAVVAALGDSTATTASRVVEMGQGMAAAASIAGMSETDIMAIAAAVGSLGIESASGATSMSTLISTLYKATETGKNLEEFASVAGMTASEFKTAWAEDAVGALNAFIQGLNDTERNGKSAIVLLEELGITNVRQTKAILGLASAGDLLSRTVALGNEAWASNSALAEKAGIMYETTEAKTAMLSNSVTNLKIAVGDQLTPAIGNLAEKGTDIVNWATEFVEANDWLAPSITAVVVAMTAFMAVLAGYAAITKVVIPAITALNAAMSANPYLLAAAAITAVIAALTVLTLTMDSTADSGEKLSYASQEQASEISALTAEYEKACAQYGANSEEAGRLAAQIEKATMEFEANKTTIGELTGNASALVSRQKEMSQSFADTSSELGGLSGKCNAYLEQLIALSLIESKSAEDKAEILAYVQLLNKALPGLDLSYDQYADSLNVATDELQNLVQAEIDHQTVLANQQALQDAISLRQEFATQTTQISSELAAAQEALAKAQEEYAAADAEWGIQKYLAFDLYTQAMAPYIEAVTQAAQDVAALEEAQASLQAANEENEATIKDLTTATANLSGAAQTNASAAETAAASVKQELEDLAKKYKEAYDSALESLDGQVGLWEKMDNKASTSAKDLQTAVDSQVTYFTNYSDNLQNLLGRNIDGVEEFAKNFTDGSTESAAALAGLSKASDEEIARIIESMGKVSEQKESLATLFAGLETDLSGNLENIATQYQSMVESIQGAGEDVDFGPFLEAVNTAFDGVGLQFETIGSGVGEGLASGIASSSGQASESSTAMAEGVIESVRSTLQSHSPSVVMEQIGEGVGEGLGEGISASEESATSAAEAMGQAITTTVETGATNAVTGFTAQFGRLTAEASRIMSETRAAVVEIAGAMSGQMQSIGYQMVAGMAAGVEGGGGILYSAVTRVVLKAIEAAKAAADVHSPSKKTEKIFSDVGEGMVVGITKKKEEVVDATQDVVNAALGFDTQDMIDAIKASQDGIPDITALLAAGFGQSRDESVHNNKAEITNNFYVNEMTDSQMNEIVQVLNEELGGMVI